MSDHNIKDLTYLVARLAGHLGKVAPDDKLAADAVAYLKRHRLLSPLRAEQAEAALAASAGAVPNIIACALDWYESSNKDEPAHALAMAVLRYKRATTSAASQLGSTQDPPPGDWSTDIREGRAASRPSAPAQAGPSADARLERAQRVMDERFRSAAVTNSESQP